MKSCTHDLELALPMRLSVFLNRHNNQLNKKYPMRTLNVLVACETSGTVRDAFLAKGHNAISVDLLPHDSGGSARHIQGDILRYLSRRQTPFDLMIAHPPCTYLCNSGVSWLFHTPDPNTVLTRLIRGIQSGRTANKGRVFEMRAAATFFNALLNYSRIPYIAVENPVQHCYARQLIRRQDQVVQPWMFGHPESKATCFWLKDLPPLVATDNVRHIWKSLPKKQRNRLNWLPPSPLRWKLRSKTYAGIAQAMADQWGDHVMRELNL